ncbi:MAG: hypothetical protein AAGE94_15860 [Acidobacteriota bacterium]
MLSTQSTQRLAHQRLLVERALIRFVVDERLVSIAALAPFLVLDDASELRSDLLHDDTVFPAETERHYALMVTVQAAIHPLTSRPEGLKAPSVGGGHEMAAVGTEIAPDLLQVVGDRFALFQLVSELSRDPQAVWNRARAALDGTETVH